MPGRHLCWLLKSAFWREGHPVSWKFAGPEELRLLFSKSYITFALWKTCIMWIFLLRVQFLKISSTLTARRENLADLFTGKTTFKCSPQLMYLGFLLKIMCQLFLLTTPHCVFYIHIWNTILKILTSFDLFKSSTSHFGCLSLPQIAHRGINQCKTFTTFN